MAYSRVTGVSTMFDCNTPVYNELGVNIASAADSKTAMTLAGLDWEVDQRPIQVCGGRKIPDMWANVRSDTGDVLGLVTKRYKPVQNADAFVFTDELLGNGVSYETAGVLKDGQRVWMLARVESHQDYKLANDECIPYLLFTNNHDGKGSVKVCLTVTRVWCQNTLNLAIKNAARTWTMRHCGDIEAKLEEARQTLQLTERYLGMMQAKADEMTQVTIAPAFMSDFANQLFPIDEHATDRKNENNLAAQALLTNIYANKDDVKPYQGTLWGAYLALTDYASHAREGRKTATSQENRFISMFDGERDLATTGTSLLYKMAGINA